MSGDDWDDCISKVSVFRTCPQGSFVVEWLHVLGFLSSDDERWLSVPKDVPEEIFSLMAELNPFYVPSRHPLKGEKLMTVKVLLTITRHLLGCLTRKLLSRERRVGNGRRIREIHLGAVETTASKGVIAHQAATIEYV